MVTRLMHGCPARARTLLPIALLTACSTSEPPHNAALRPAASASLGSRHAPLLTPSAASGPTREARKKELRKVVDDNTGHAHLQRGMNSFTIAALQKATSAADLPVLEELLFDSDRVVAMTAAEVLMTLGGGRAALERAKATAERAHSPELSSMLDDRLRELAARAQAPSLAPAER